jgi:hypothetical protein
MAIITGRRAALGAGGRARPLAVWAAFGLATTFAGAKLSLLNGAPPTWLAFTLSTV